MNEEQITPETELALVDALLAGTDQPVEINPEEDLSVPATPPHATVKADEVSEGEHDVVDLLTPEPEETPSPSPKRGKAPKAEKTERKDRVAAFSDGIAIERCRNLLGDDLDDIIIGMGAAPKKVADKVYNVLCHLADRGKLSAYTKIGIQALRDNPVNMASVTLIERYKAAGYSEATARSQAHQQMVALPILGIASKGEHTLSLIGDAEIVGLLLAKEYGGAETTSPPPTTLCEETLLAEASEDASKTESEDESLLTSET